MSQNNVRIPFGLALILGISAGIMWGQGDTLATLLCAISAVWMAVLGAGGLWGPGGGGPGRATSQARHRHGTAPDSHYRVATARPILTGEQSCSNVEFRP